MGYVVIDCCFEEKYEKVRRSRRGTGLNIGDCCAYALSKYTGEALLYKGDDFGKTDAAGVL